MSQSRCDKFFWGIWFLLFCINPLNTFKENIAFPFLIKSTFFNHKDGCLKSSMYQIRFFYEGEAEHYIYRFFLFFFHHLLILTSKLKLYWYSFLHQIQKLFFYIYLFHLELNYAFILQLFHLIDEMRYYTV